MDTRPERMLAYPRHKTVWAIDLVFANPWRRIHFCPDKARYDLTAPPPGGQAKKVELMIENMIEYADNGSVNTVLRNVLDKGMRVSSGRFTFTSGKAFDSYVFWLLQVKSFGGDIGEI